MLSINLIKGNIYEIYDGLLLPPDRESNGIFDLDTWKGLFTKYVRSFYYRSMPEKYMSEILEAMTHELLEFEPNHTILTSFKDFYIYITKVSFYIRNFYDRVGHYDLYRITAVIC